MICPYCDSSISSLAKVCPQCTRDLWLIQSLQEEVQDLREQLAAWQEGALNVSSSAEAPLSLSPADVQHSDELAPAAWRLVGAALVSIALAMGLHWLLLFVYDVNPLVLRVATIVVPAWVAAVALRSARLQGPAVAVASALTGALAVWGMLTVTGVLDNVPITPQNLRDWRETLEYGLAMALGFLTGALCIGGWRQYQKRRAAKARAGLLALLLRRDARGRIDVDQLSEEVQRLVTVAGPVVSGGMALYSGVKSLMG
jgi:hypothetical protein